MYSLVLEICPVLNLLSCRTYHLRAFFWVASGCLVLAGSTPAVLGMQDEGAAVTGQTGEPQGNSGAIAADLFQFPPTEPEDLIRAARTTQRLDRVDDARAFLRQFIDLGLSEVDLRAIRSEIGPANFLALRQDQRLSPEAERVLKLVNAAAASKTVTPDQMQAAVGKLTASDFDGTVARQELVSYPEVSAEILLNVDPSTAEGRVAESLLEEHIVGFRHALLRALNSTDLSASHQVRSIRLLGLSADPEIGDRLLRWQFGDDVKVAVTAKAAVALLHGKAFSTDTVEGAGNYLIGKAESLMSKASDRFSSLRPTSAMMDLKMTDPRVAAYKLASELLSDALKLNPDDFRARNLLAVASLAAGSGPVEAPSNVASELSTKDVIDELSVALELRNAKASVELLKSLRGRSLNESDDLAAVDAIRTGLKSSDPAVRFFAALNAKDRPGLEVSAAQVRQCLSSVKNGSTRPEAVVVTGDDRLLSDLKFTLGEAGFQVAAVESAPDAFDAAAQQMNCELFLVSAEAPTWPLAVTLSNLRADVRTQSVPVVVFGPPKFESKVNELSKIYPGVWFTTQPLGTALTEDTQIADNQFGKIRTSRSELRLQLEPLNLPEPLLSTADRTALQALID